MVCKTRKKKCNKLLPSCGYCIRKHLKCAYAPILRSRDRPPSNNDLLTAPSWGARPPTSNISGRTTSSNHVYLEVHSLIRGTGQFVDDITTRYFQVFHRQLPIISRTRFYDKLTRLGTDPGADFSVLLLAVCLITHAPALGYQPAYNETRSVEQQSLYLTAKSLYAQVQVSCQPSISLIQAGLLIAVYEYRHRRPDDAFMTVTGSVRMAYAARIHTHDRYQATGSESKTDFLSQAEEAANTWWGLTIFERLFFVELPVLDQPLLTVFPDGNARLPIEHQTLDQLDVLDTELIPNIALSCWTSAKVGGFGRMAQATCLLEQVFKSCDTQDIDLRLLQLDSLDNSIQSFLSSLMPECRGKPGINCTAIHIAIRALFLLHGHILAQTPQVLKPKFKPLFQWWNISQEALDTVTKIIADIAELLVTAVLSNTATYLKDTSPPTYPYVTFAALKHLECSDRTQNADSINGAREILQLSLHQYFERWNVSKNCVHQVRTYAEKQYAVY